MKARLNITINDALLDEVKVYAAKHDSSVSQLIENYLEKLVHKGKKPSLLDVLKSLPKSDIEVDYPEDFDFKKEYYEDRKKKYGF